MLEALCDLPRWLPHFLGGIHKILLPLSSRLSKTVNRLSIEGKGPSLSVDDLEQALELTSDESTSEDEQRILQGIVRFGSTSVKEVMTPRTSVVAIEQRTGYHEALSRMTESGYSRIPVFEENLDQIKGCFMSRTCSHIWMQAKTSGGKT